MPTSLRAIASAVLFAAFGVSCVGGLCPMTAADGSLTENVATRHDCCKTGLSGKAPSCCHAGNAETDIAVVKSVSAMAHPVSAAAVTVLLPVERPRVASIRLACLSHGPPLTVLRV